MNIIGMSQTVEHKHPGSVPQRRQRIVKQLIPCGIHPFRASRGESPGGQFRRAGDIGDAFDTIARYSWEASP
jgi:hypothetical protein